MRRVTAKKIARHVKHAFELERDAQFAWEGIDADQMLVRVANTRTFWNRYGWARDEWSLAALYLVVWLLTPDQQLDLFHPRAEDGFTGAFE